jgi:hypothetical protein
MTPHPPALSVRTFQPHPEWPAQRPLSRYEELVGFSITEKLSSGGVCVDIGPGTHAVALRALEGLKNVTLAALTTDTVDVSQTRIEVTHGRIPDATNFLSRYYRSCRVVTDIFSSVTYVEDPAHALLAIAMLPERDGIAGVFTELDKFGSMETWGAIRDFFTREMGQTITFSRFRITGDAEPISVECLRVVIEGMCRRSVDELPQLKHLLHQELGAPSVGREIWKTKDGKATISEINYARFPRPAELMRLATIK